MDINVDVLRLLTLPHWLDGKSDESGDFLGRENAPFAECRPWSIDRGEAERRINVATLLSLRNGRAQRVERDIACIGRDSLVTKKVAEALEQ